MKDLGDVHYFLSLQITRTNAALTITQTRYLLSLLHKFGLAGAKPVATPIASGTTLTAINDTLLSDPMPFHQLVDLYNISHLPNLISLMFFIMFINTCMPHENLTSLLLKEFFVL
jgi:hypothetical protein